MGKRGPRATVTRFETHGRPPRLTAIVTPLALRYTGQVGARTIDSGDHDAALAALREHLCELQLPQIVHRRRAIILFEGPHGSGKKAALRQLAAAFDPCHYAVHCTRHERRESSEGHWLARFWRELPGAGDTAIFFRSWYRRVLDDRIAGHVDDDALARAFDEINEFEAQQRDYGTLIVKLFFDVAPDIQEARLSERAADPWRRVVRGDQPISVRDPAYAAAVNDLRANSDTRWSPWRIIDGNDEARGTIAALSAIADAWAESMPSEPPHLVETPGRAA
jgi:AMP-polyphosphate phosphotransferase